MRTHAAMPFAEPLQGHRVRIYFNSRDRQNRCHVGYLETDLRRPDKVLFLSPQPLLSPGRLGSFDEDGVMLSWKVPLKGKNYIYYAGWNLGVSVPFRNSIGLAYEKKEGKAFQRAFDGPLLDRGIHDPCFITNPCVLKEKGVWKMWYLSCVRWKKLKSGPRHWYHLKYAESKDGIEWKREGKVCIDFKNDREYAISRPCVLKEGSLYRMWYAYRGDRYRIGYAESKNGVDWDRKDEEVGIDISPSGWDSEMVENPFVFKQGGHHYLLYNGNAFGKTGFGLARLENEPGSL